MVPGGRSATSGGENKVVANAMAIPKTPKKTEKPPHIKIEMRAQLRRRMSPMPVATPNADRAMVKPVTAKAAVLTKGGNAASAEVCAVPSQAPKNANDMDTKTSSAVRIATTAARMTAVEARGTGDMLIFYNRARDSAKGNCGERVLDTSLCIRLEWLWKTFHCR